MPFTFDSDYSQEDYTADAVNEDADNSSSLEATRAGEAATAEVQDARHIGYADVLSVYEARTDTESLANRRARALAVDPADQDFTRHVNYTGDDAGKSASPPAEDTSRTAG